MADKVNTMCFLWEKLPNSLSNGYQFTFFVFFAHLNLDFGVKSKSIF